MRGLTLAALAVLGLASLAAGLVRQPEAAPPQPAPGITEAAIIAAATRAVEARLPQAQRQDQAPLWDGVALFRFGPEDERAVCGRVRTAAMAEPQDFVARVLLPRTQARLASGEGARLLVVMEAGPGVQTASHNAAGRYCREAGQEAVAAARPPAEGAAPAAESLHTGAGATASPAESAAPMPQALVRSPARLREAGHGGAAVLRVAGTGEAFRVFAFGPGGWLQVGEAEPQGWIHGSLLEVRR